MESVDSIRRVFKVAGWLPDTIWVVEACPLDLVLELVSMVSGVEDFLHFPLLLFLDNSGRWWWLVVAGDGFRTGYGFEEADVEDWVRLDSGRQA